MADKCYRIIANGPGTLVHHCMTTPSFLTIMHDMYMFECILKSVRLELQTSLSFTNLGAVLTVGPTPRKAMRNVHLINVNNGSHS